MRGHAARRTLRRQPGSQQRVAASLRGMGWEICRTRLSPAREAIMRESTTPLSAKLLSALAMCLACVGLATVSAQQAGAPSGSGPYPAIAESRAELPRHTFYRPVELPRAA